MSDNTTYVTEDGVEVKLTGRKAVKILPGEFNKKTMHEVVTISDVLLPQKLWIDLDTAFVVQK